MFFKSKMLTINLLFLSTALLLFIGELSMGLLGNYDLSFLAILAAALMIIIIKLPNPSRATIIFSLLANTALVIWLSKLIATAIGGGNPIFLVALAVFIATPLINCIHTLKLIRKPVSLS